MENTIRIKTREGKLLKVSENIKTYSKFIRETIEDSLTDDDIVCDVPEFVFSKILEFFEYHGNGKEIKNIKKPVKISNFTTLTSEWDAAFFKKLEEEQLAELLSGASYLEIDSLYDYCCAFIACQLKDMTIDEVRTKYDITEELTPQLEELIKKEYSNILKDLSE